MQKPMNTPEFTLPSCTMNRSLPWALTADSMFTDHRAPLLVTTGVRPTGAQVVPAW